jgi:CheY-like chemotaxis protein/signal transduction histidine kinase
MCPMETLARLIDRRAPLGLQATCTEALARFSAEPRAMALAVVDGVRPVGLVVRDAFLTRMSSESRLAEQPVTEVMEPYPLIVQATQSATEFQAQTLASRPAALLRGFIAVDGEAYLGVGNALSLLSRTHSGREEAVSAEGALVQRLSDEVSARLDGALAFSERAAAITAPNAGLGDDARAWICALTRAGRSVRDLMANAADLHRARSGELAFELKPRRLRDMVDALEARWSARAQDAGSTLLVSYDGDPEFAADMDMERLLQVFDALIGRALAQGHAQGRGGAIEAGLRARPILQGVMLEGSVRDSGGLMRPAELAHLFDLAGPDGAGQGDLSVRLGMALSRSLIHAMDGVIAVEANVGAGATVTFQVVVPEAAVEAPAAEHAAQGRTAHILIVDDNATNRMVAEALCEMFDCTSEQVEDGVEAVEAATARPFDLILMDIRMPRMDGVAATRAIRALPGPAGQTPIIALTANADPEDAKTYLAAGMNGVVEKPIKPHLLLAALEQALAGPDESSPGEQVAASVAA